MATGKAQGCVDHSGIVATFKVGRAYLNPSDYWAFRCRDLLTGEAFRLSTGSRDKVEARKSLRALLEVRRAGGCSKERRAVGAVSDAQGVSWAVLYQQFLDAKTCRPEAITQFRLYPKIYGKFFREKSVHQITRADIETLLKDFHERGRRWRTIHGHLVLLRSFFERCLQDELIPKNPARGIKVHRGEQREGIPLTHDEARRLLMACRENIVREVSGKRWTGNAATWQQTWAPPEYLWLAVLIALHTGLRRGNVLNLRWRQIDLEQRSITIGAADYKARRRHVVPVHPELAEVLSARWKEGRAVKDIPGTPTTMSEIVKEIRDLGKKLVVRQKLSSFGRALSIVDSPKIDRSGAHYYLISLDAASKRVRVFSYKRHSLEQAGEKYREEENKK